MKFISNMTHSNMTEFCNNNVHLFISEIYHVSHSLQTLAYPTNLLDFPHNRHNFLKFNDELQMINSLSHQLNIPRQDNEFVRQTCHLSKMQRYTGNK